MTQLFESKWLNFLGQNDSNFFFHCFLFLSLSAIIAQRYGTAYAGSLSLFRKGFWEKSKVQCISKALLIGLQDASLMVQSAVKWVEPETAQRSARLLRQASGCANGSAQKRDNSRNGSKKALMVENERLNGREWGA